MRPGLAVLLFLTGSVAFATLTVQPHVASSTNCDGAQVIVAAVCPGPICSVPRTADFDADGLLFPVSANAPWHVSVRGRCWGEALTEPGRQTVAVDVWPSSVISGSFEIPRGDSPPASLKAKLQTVPRAKPVLDGVEAECAVRGMAWRCVVPATALDVRLAPAGYIPAYLWSIHPPAGAVLALGKLDLARGGSVTGVVENRSGQPVSGASVSLSTESFARDEKRLAIGTLPATTNERGFFQFRNVAAGTYVINASKEGLSPGRAPGVRVEDGNELALPRPIQLHSLGSVQLFLSPPNDPHQKPWNVRFDRHGIPSNLLIPVAKGEASIAGEWRRDGLPSGSYVAMITDSTGNVVLQREVEVADDAAPQVVRIDALSVHGVVTLAGKPSKAKLAFSDGRGARVNFETDDSGVFAGMLPHEGNWNVQWRAPGSTMMRRLRALEIKKRGDASDAVVDIALPGGRLKGLVVDDKGHPQVAGVRLFREGVPDAEMHSGSDGRFEFVAVSTGPATLNAVTLDGQLSSSLVPAEVDEHESADVQLVVRHRNAIRGWLTTPDGNPVPGALIRFIDVHAVAECGTDPSGEFELTFPDGTSAIDALVVPPGLPMKIVQIPTAAERPHIIVGGTSGVLRIRLGNNPPWPAIRRDGMFFPLFMTLLPGELGQRPRNLMDGGLMLDIDAGAYTICPETRMSSRCVIATVAAGQQALVDTRDFYKNDPGGTHAPSP